MVLIFILPSSLSLPFIVMDVALLGHFHFRVDLNSHHVTCLQGYSCCVVCGGGRTAPTSLTQLI